ncbi:Yip1 family protein [Leptospira stimsonii]|uniref:YIP1 family protein n=1 Tax=Leptospira stimsonii TaxID=2202203 RepID=A0ABY2N1K1_9LEPT|nr:Yip1 family protein [Leptospira stimsonii]TGK20535.1 YIP1 family protein [Leptospira stimsonii]TGM14325.1 YIP1 family protein [Leptospira stimsonii]
MFQFSYSFQNILTEARDLLIRPISFFRNLPKTKESALTLYFRFLTFLGFLYIGAVLSMTLFTPLDMPNPPVSFLLLEMPLAYFLASLIVFPILGFLYMLISWICGGVTNWSRNFRASTAVFSTFWVAIILQSFGGLIHVYVGIGIGVAFTAYIPFLFYLALTSYLEAPIKRTAITLGVFTSILFYVQYSRMASYIDDYRMIENMNSHKPLSREEEEKGEQEAAEIIRKAMEKARSEGNQIEE